MPVSSRNSRRRLEKRDFAGTARRGSGAGWNAPRWLIPIVVRLEGARTFVKRNEGELGAVAVRGNGYPRSRERDGAEVMRMR